MTRAQHNARVFKDQDKTTSKGRPSKYAGSEWWDRSVRRSRGNYASELVKIRQWMRQKLGA